MLTLSMLNSFDSFTSHVLSETFEALKFKFFGQQVLYSDFQIAILFCIRNNQMTASYTIIKSWINN